MKIREIAPERDLPEVSEWFANIQWEYPGDNLLPTDGLVLEDEHGLVACAFMYITGTGVSRVAWTATNPKRSQENRSEAIKTLISKIQELSPRLDPPISTLELMTKSDAFSQSLKNLGFRTSKGWTRAIWVHDPGKEIRHQKVEGI